MSITKSLIGSMNSINTALNAMGLNEIRQEQAQKEQEKKTTEVYESQEMEHLRQTNADASELVKQAREMREDESGTSTPRDVMIASAIGREEKKAAAESVLNKWFPKLAAEAKKGGIIESRRLNYDLQNYLKEYDKGIYSGSFEAYHKRSVKQRAREEIKRKKQQERREKIKNGKAMS